MILRQYGIDVFIKDVLIYLFIYFFTVSIATLILDLHGH